MEQPTRPTDNQNATEGAASLAQKLRAEGRQQIDSTRRTAAQQVESIADAIDAARSRLDETQPTLAKYTANLADGVERIATRLRDASLEDLARDAKNFAARNPGLFVLGSAAAGVVLARFLKLTSPGAPSTGSFRDAQRSSRSPASTARPVSPEEGEPAVGGSYGTGAFGTPTH
jgi:hypothetical protein